MMLKGPVVFMMVWLGCFAVAGGQPVPGYSRGEALYQTHCIGCHTAEVHWRDRKVATDWASLKSEVNLWQKTNKLGWREEDVVDVARYLNALHYHFPAPGVGRSPAEGVETLTQQK